VIINENNSPFLAKQMPFVVNIGFVLIKFYIHSKCTAYNHTCWRKM